MEKRIDKLERVKPMALMGMMGEVAPQWVAKELNKIIDHLNSQDQEEENTVCEGCGKTITSRFMQSYTKGDGMHSYCLSCDPEKQDTPEEKIEIPEAYRKAFLNEDTPGEWEEIRKKLNGIAVEYNIINRVNAIQEEIERLLEEKTVVKKSLTTGNEEQRKGLYVAIEDILSDYHIGLFTDAFYITKLVELFEQLLEERELKAYSRGRNEQAELDGKLNGGSICPEISIEEGRKYISKLNNKKK